MSDLADNISNPSRLCIFIPSFGDGGVERMMVNLAGGLYDLGIEVDFTISRFEGPYLTSLPPGVRVVECKTAHPEKVIPELSRYLAQERPRVLMSVKRCGQEALLARELARSSVRLFVRVGTTLSQKAKGQHVFKRLKNLFDIRKYCIKADGIIAVSQGVAEDIHRITGIAADKISVVNNPVISPQMQNWAQHPIAHPWFNDPHLPVVLGVGGLRRAKDFPTLVRAFAQVRTQRPAKLTILGEGRQRKRLEALAKNLGVQDDVFLAGFVDNPYAYMRRSDVFVLSSLWEGSPNVLTEAMALGTPVVATDCQSGPREILQNGKLGVLVPVGDSGQLAQAILATLANPPDPQILQSAVSNYTIEASAAQYSQALGLGVP